MSIGIDTATGYFFRGIRQEDRGVIFQPWAEATFPVVTEGPVPLDFTVGTWNSLHDGPTGSGAGGSAWYESDVYFSFSTQLLEIFSASASYAVYESPNNQWSSVQELVFDVAVDDSGFWGDALGESFGGLQPSVAVAVELDGQMDSGTNEGVYFQLGIEPSFGLIDRDGWTVETSVPVTVGLGGSGYYENLGRGARNEEFGFFDIGFTVSSTLPIVPTRFGNWQVSAGVHLLVLGESNERLNNGEDGEVIGSLGLSLNF